MTANLQGLVAATHTPFGSDGALNLDVVERQAAHLLRDGVTAAFVGGTTGEAHSLTVDERLALAARWADATRGSGLRLIVHVGANCLADARALAAQAERLGAFAISALAPSYFKPRTVDALVACCAEVAGAAPATPFYYYDIPSMTGVSLPIPAFLEAAAGRIPNLVGVKFSNMDMMAYQHALRLENGRFDIPWGTDECLLAALALGATSAVGSTYNFAAPLYHRLWGAFRRGDWPEARLGQHRAVTLVDLLASFGFMAAAKATMGFLDVPVGPPRLPQTPLADGQVAELRTALDRLGFFDWGRG